MDEPGPRGPLDPLVVPRFAGPSTFARLPRLDEVEHADVGVAGIPFDSGVTYRPGARFGPIAVRNASRLLRGYHAGLDVRPFAAQQVVDAGDIACNPFSIDESIAQIEAGSRELLGAADRLVCIGGDHTIALPLLRTVRERHGPVALVHFDAHLDTWDTYFGAAYTHGTPFRRAWEEGLLLEDRSIHLGIRGPLFSAEDLVDDASFGFRIVTAWDVLELGIAETAARVRERVRDAPMYVSIDIILAGFLLVFVFTLGSYLIAAILGRPEHWTLSVFISDQASFNANVPFAAAMAIFLTVLSLVVVGIMTMVESRTRSSA